MRISERINTLDDILDYMKTVLGAIELERNEIASSDDTFEQRMDMLNDVIVDILVFAEDSAKYFNKILDIYEERREPLCTKNQRNVLTMKYSTRIVERS